MINRLVQASPLELSEAREQAITYLKTLWDESTGGFRFATHQPATLMATAYSVLGLEFVGGLASLTNDHKSAIISFLMSGVQADGSFKDPLFKVEDILSQQHDLTYFQEETTTFCQQALDALLAPPPPPRQWLKSWDTAEGLIQYFESFPWENPWLDSNRVMFALSQLCHDAERHQKPELLKLVDVALDWLDEHQSPETGLWQGLHEVSLTNAMAATFHFTFYYGYRRRPLKYVEKIIDSCLQLQQPHGLFSGNEIGQTCLDYDALDLLAKASLVTDYRSLEVQRATQQAYEALLTLQNPEDGGFCDRKANLVKPHGGRKVQLLRKLGLSGLMPSSITPAQGTYQVCWALLSCDTKQSNAFSTWFRLLGLSLATQKQWLNAESSEKLTFRRLPFLGYHDPLAIQCADNSATTTPKIQLQQNYSELKNPLISVIIPAYNAQQTLSQTLVSLRAQTYPYWEAIIVNDGSTDQTSQLAHQWSQTDSRLQVIDQKNTGLGGARNTALKVAKGKFVHCLDSDDLIEPYFYQWVIQALSQVSSSDSLGSCAVCSFQMFTHAGQGKFLEKRRIPNTESYQFYQLAKVNHSPPATLVFERSILELTGTFDESLRHCQDWDLWLRFARIGVNFVAVPEALALYRTGEMSLSRRYDTYVNAASQLLWRITKEDQRCASVENQSAVIPKDIVENTIIRLWQYNLQRAASQKSESGMVKLFAWAIDHFPPHFWQESVTTGNWCFHWIEARPERGRELESEIEHRLFYLNMLNQLWPVSLPLSIVKLQIQGLRYLIITSKQSLNLSKRISFSHKVLSWKIIESLGIYDFIFYSISFILPKISHQISTIIDFKNIKFKT